MDEYNIRRARILVFSPPPPIVDVATAERADRCIREMLMVAGCSRHYRGEFFAESDRRTWLAHLVAWARRRCGPRARNVRYRSPLLLALVVSELRARIGLEVAL